MDNTPYKQSDLLRIVQGEYERRRVDFKTSVAWKSPLKRKFTKQIAAFSNAGGGYIVIGVDENKKSLKLNRIGVDPKHLATWDTTSINQDIANYISPAIDVDVIRVPDDSKTFIVLAIPPHQTVPHICTRDINDSRKLLLREGALYYRTTKKACEEIKKQEDWRDLIRRCVRNDKEELYEMLRSVVDGRPYQFKRDKDREPPKTNANRSNGREHIEKTSTGAVRGVGGIIDVNRKQAKSYRPDLPDNSVFREIVAYPIDLWQSVDISQVKSALDAACWDYRGWPYLFYLPNHSVPLEFADGEIFSYDNKIFGRYQKFEYWAFNYLAGLLYTQDLTYESSYGTPLVFNPVFQANLMAEAVVTIGRLYDGIGLPADTAIKTEITYLPAKGIKVGTHDEFQFRVRESAPYSGERLHLVLTEPLAGYLSKTTEIASNGIHELVGRLGYRGNLLESLKTVTKQHLAKGHKV